MVYLNFKPKIGIPSAFSPNGDGNNDVLAVEGQALDVCNLKVYNRYGIQIFESSNQKNGWDGNSKGRRESPGVYYWTLEYEFNTGKNGTLSGNTTLIR
jgi:gliding motility-associated-like protein